jgi:hypothetical protein
VDALNFNWKHYRPCSRNLITTLDMGLDALGKKSVNITRPTTFLSNHNLKKNIQKMFCVIFPFLDYSLLGFRLDQTGCTQS